MNPETRQPHAAFSHFEYLHSLLATARSRPGLWAIPLLAAGLIGFLVAFLGPRQWQATQAFMVREELIGRIVGPGRFESLDTMKTAQETIQEVAKRPGVLRRMLIGVGPTTGNAGEDWPSEQVVEDFQGAISFYAPNGAEFGKTEVLMMVVKSSSRDRARQLVTALFDELQIELRKIRQQRAASMLTEVEQAVDFAQEQLALTAAKLRNVETQVGADLAELRNLNDPTSGSGQLREMFIQIQSELRSARTDQETYRKQLEHLEYASQDTDQLLATPRELLELQPALARLKENLIDAQIKESTLRGRYSEAHPLVAAATFAVADIKRQIDTELAHAIRGLESQIQLAESHVQSLDKQANDIENRLQELVAMRVEYGQLVDQITQRQTDLTMAQKELLQAESIRRAAEHVDMLTALDEPQVAINPIGPSKKTTLAGALLAGACIGLGLLMLMTPATPPASFTAAPVARPPQAKPSGNSESMVTAAALSSPVFVIPDINSPTYVETTQTR